MLSKVRPTAFDSKLARLEPPRDTATVVRREARFFDPELWFGSYTALLTKLVPKYTRVPVMAATLALLKKD